MTLVFICPSQHIGDMDRLANALLAAIDVSPCSERALAQAAGIDHSLLIRIRNGERSATPVVADKIADALEAWSEDCSRAAQRLRRVTQQRRAR